MQKVNRKRKKAGNLQFAILLILLLRMHFFTDGHINETISMDVMQLRVDIDIESRLTIAVIRNASFYYCYLIPPSH